MYTLHPHNLPFSFFCLSVLTNSACSLLNEGSPTETINDLLWLPTEWKMLRTTVQASNETENNQVYFVYFYEEDEKHLRLYKALENNQFPPPYWLASASKWGSTAFSVVDSFVSSAANKATLSKGVVPAFCVYGWPKSRQ
jgi:hypothetical protein